MKTAVFWNVAPFSLVDRLTDISKVLTAIIERAMYYF
jgi:hypothetical protein